MLLLIQKLFSNALKVQTTIVKISRHERFKEPAWAERKVELTHHCLVAL